jgi:hypothetical protein
MKHLSEKTTGKYNSIPHNQEARRLTSLTCKSIVTNNRQKELLYSPHGVKLLKSELENLFFDTANLVKNRSGQQDGLKMEFIIKRRSCTLRAGRYAVQLFLDSKYKNTVENSVLYLRSFRGKYPQGPGSKTAQFKGKMISERMFTFVLGREGKRRWHEMGLSDRRFNSEDLAGVFVATLTTALSSP